MTDEERVDEQAPMGLADDDTERETRPDPLENLNKPHPTWALTTLTPMPDELRRVQDVRLTLTAEIGEAEFSVGYWLALGIGSRIPLRTRWEDPLILRLNGKQVGRGAVVLVGNKFGVEVTEWGAV